MSASMLDEALSLARLGLQVFALAPRSKEPRAGTHGHLDASTDETTILALWKQTPDANTGIFCKGSGIVVIDVDPRHGGEKTFAIDIARLGSLPATPTVRSGGADRGRQFYFRAAPHIRFPQQLGPGVDVKWNGYAVTPPSIHPSGRAYEWQPGLSLYDLPLAELPVAWRNALDARARASVAAAQIRRVVSARPTATRTSPGYARRALEKEYQIIGSTTKGDRNARLHHAACALSRFVDSGELSAIEVLAHLGAAARICGLPPNEAQRTIESGLSQRQRGGR